MNVFGMSYEEQKKRGEAMYDAKIRHCRADFTRAPP